MLNKFFSRRETCAKLALLACSLFLAVSAQADPAGRIGRVALLSGTVNLYNADTGESFPVPLNQPLTSGDILTAEPDARTEIQIGSMTIRLDSGSQLELKQIDDEQVRLELKSGRAIAKLPARDAISDFSLDTPDGHFTASETGIYRFDSDADSSVATVYRGALHFSSSDLARDVDSGQSEQFWYDGQTRSRPTTLVNDDFTQWSAVRDRRPPSTTYARYVSPEMTGAEDLDAYGNWSSDPELGAIWFPRHVDRDWAPYRTGHWVWISPWGWNWVDNEPWGFAPFHYGRWVNHRGAWGWVPGTRVVRPVYSPAMVAWVGAAGVGVSIGIGAAPSVGWFPLAPREVYVPSYRTSVNYVRNVNITHVTNITNITTIVNHPQEVVRQTHYANRNVPQAMTVVPANVVAQRRPVAAAMLPSKDRGALSSQPIQVAAPVAAPKIDPQAEARNRQEHPDRGISRRDNPPSDRNAPPGSPRDRDAKPSAVVPAPQAPGVAPQRNDRPTPEVQRPANQPKPESTPAPLVPNKREASPPPAPVPPTVVPQRNERPVPEVQRPASPPRPESPQAPVAPDKREATPPVPVAPVVIPPRNERPVPEVQRPANPPRPESPPAPTEPRNRAPNPPIPAPQIVVPQRNERPTPEVQRLAVQPRQEPMPAPTAPKPREINPAPPAPAPRIVAPQRVERPMPEVQRPAPQPRAEPPQVQSPREAAKPAEPRPEARPQRQDERQHQEPSEEELKRRKAAGQQP